MKEPFDGEWFNNICGRNMEEFDIRPRLTVSPVPICLFKTTSLETLRLSRGECLLNLTENSDPIYLPCLKKLHVQGLSTSHWCSIEKLINSCLSLEELSLIFSELDRLQDVMSICAMNLKRLLIGFDFKANFYGKVIIDAPKLEYLTFRTSYGFIDNSCTMALLEARMKNYTCSSDGWDFKSAHYIGISSIKSFEISISRQFLAPIKFPYLTRLELDQRSGLDQSFSPNGLLQILHSCSVLENLICQFDKIPEEEKEDDLTGNSPEAIVHGCFLTHVKKIEINTRVIHRRMFKLIEFLLGKAHCLELLVFNQTKPRCQKDIKYEELMFYEEINKCQKGSSQWQIEFSGYYVVAVH